MNEGLAVERITPHGLYNPADISSEIELVPELRVTTSHLDI